MLISCPNCATQFAVPEAALGTKGRTLKCARCAHTWFQPPPPPPEPELEPQEAAAESRGLPGFENFSVDETADATPPQDAAETREAGRDLEDGEAAREPIPAALTARRGDEAAAKGRGAGVLWTVLALLIVLGAALYGVYAFQDRLVALWPPLGDYLEKAGLRRELVGAGLAFRNSNSERVVQGDKEVLIVRGVIANLTDQPRDVPMMRLALFDNETLVQDKVVRPPADGLDPGATTSFRISLEQPHPMATRFEVTFVAQLPATDPVR